MPKQWQQQIVLQQQRDGAGESWSVYHAWPQCPSPFEDIIQGRSPHLPSGGGKSAWSGSLPSPQTTLRPSTWIQQPIFLSSPNTEAPHGAGVSQCSLPPCGGNARLGCPTLQIQLSTPHSALTDFCSWQLMYLVLKRKWWWSFAAVLEVQGSNPADDR